MTLPDTAPWWLFVLAIVAPIAGTWVTNRNQRRQNGTLNEVREQVSNTHSTNLRDDLDAIHSTVRDLRDDVRDLRDEVRSDRAHQYDFEREVWERLRP